MMALVQVRESAIAFVDPDGYRLILSPDRWQ
jgi:hypothetical protein